MKKCKRFFNPVDPSDKPKPTQKREDILKIAEFLDQRLDWGLLNEVVLPGHLAKKYEEMTPDKQKELFEHAFNRLFPAIALAFTKTFKRGLEASELSLIRRRIINHLENCGMNYEK